MVMGACAPPEKDRTQDSPPEACNGHRSLCDRPLNEVVFAASHNSMSSEERGWLAPNHRYAMPTQLDDGIRALNLDVHDEGGVAMLCHGYCSLGRQRLVDGLAEIAGFLHHNPSEVVLLTFEMYASSELVIAAFDESGLSDQVVTLNRDEDWPTLGALVAADTRLVVFTGSGGGEPDWYHSMWTWWWDNPYAAEQVSDFSCAVYRGTPDNPLMAINHFLTSPISLQALAEVANQAEVLEDHITACSSEAGRRPNLVMVDFYSIGDVMEVVDGLNEVNP